MESWRKSQFLSKVQPVESSVSLCKCCFLFFLSFFFARQCECSYAHEICLPMWADWGSPPGHICDHKLLLTLWWLGAQSRLQSPAFISDPRLSPGRRTKHSTGVPLPSHSKPWPPGCFRSCPHWEIKNTCFFVVFLFLVKEITLKTRHRLKKAWKVLQCICQDCWRCCNAATERREDEEEALMRKT